jgi:hypothetical protein
MSEAALTLHARQRVAQRGFRQGDLDLVMLLGHRTPDGYVLRDQDVQELIADLTRLRGVYVVAPDGVTVVSAYRASRRRVKRQLAKARSSVV